MQGALNKKLGLNEDKKQGAGKKKKKKNDLSALEGY